MGFDEKQFPSNKYEISQPKKPTSRLFSFSQPFLNFASDYYYYKRSNRKRKKKGLQIFIEDQSNENTPRTDKSETQSKWWRMIKTISR